jgi:hypothetical protein
MAVDKAKGRFVAISNCSPCVDWSRVASVELVLDIRIIVLFSISLLNESCNLLLRYASSNKKGNFV